MNRVLISGIEAVFQISNTLLMETCRTIGFQIIRAMQFSISINSLMDFSCCFEQDRKVLMERKE